LNNCQACHAAGSYDFSAASTNNALPNMLVSTAATGRFNSNPVSNPTGWFTVSPYVQSNNLRDYGFGFSTSNVSATLPDGLSGTQGLASCTPASPCTCTAANPCSVDLSAPYTVNGVEVTFSQKIGSVTTVCNPTTCTCTTAQPCTGVVATCSLTAPCDAQSTTLIKTPITAACSACHDAKDAVAHMESMGGLFFKPRSQLASSVEQCLICHGPGTIAPIGLMHQ
jgi:hypothetical protein